MFYMLLNVSRYFENRFLVSLPRRFVTFWPGNLFYSFDSCLAFQTGQVQVPLGMTHTKSQTSI